MLTVGVNDVRLVPSASVAVMVLSAWLIVAFTPLTVKAVIAGSVVEGGVTSPPPSPSMVTVIPARRIVFPLP